MRGEGDGVNCEPTLQYVLKHDDVDRQSCSDSLHLEKRLNFLIKNRRNLSICLLVFFELKQLHERAINKECSR